MTVTTCFHLVVVRDRTGAVHCSKCDTRFVSNDAWIDATRTVGRQAADDVTVHGTNDKTQHDD